MFRRKTYKHTRRSTLPAKVGSCGNSSQPSTIQSPFNQQHPTHLVQPRHLGLRLALLLHKEVVLALEQVQALLGALNVSCFMFD
jgi:hypothetical protein